MAVFVLVTFVIYLVTYKYKLNNLENELYPFLISFILVSAIVTFLFTIAYVILLRSTKYCLEYEIFISYASIISFVCAIVFEMLYEIGYRKGNMFDRNTYMESENLNEELNNLKQQYFERFGKIVNPYDYKFQYLDSFVYYLKQSLETGYEIENFLQPLNRYYGR